MSRSKITFSNQQGEQLAAYLDSPAQQPAAYALFAHCFTCSKNLRAVNIISRALNQAGIAVLRFDFTGLGESEGDFADTNFSSNVGDLIIAAQYLAEHHAAPSILIGHSLGGAAVLKAAGDIPGVKAVATIGAPSEAKHISHLLTHKLADIEREGLAEVSLAGRPFTIKKQFLDDLDSTSVQACIRDLKGALLVLHSPVDNMVGIANAAEIFTPAKHPKSFVSLDNADHLLTDDADARYAGQVIASWAARYLPKTPAPELERRGSTVATTGQGYRTEVMSNGFELVADEPLSVGGSDTGPSPFDYLATSLAACSTITVRMYADRKQWPLSSVSLEVKRSKAPSAHDPSKNVVLFIRILTLEGPLDASQRQRLLEIADRCPVHRALTGEVQVQTELAASL